MKCLIYQYDNRGDLYDVYPINKLYADKFGYIYKFYTNEVNIPVYWQKVIILYNEIDNYDIIMFLDSDALIHNMTFPLEHYLGNKIFVMSPDENSIFNAGVFIIKKCELSKKLVYDWLLCYKTTKWYKDKDGNFYTDGIWSGEDYEQGAFIKYLYNQYLKHINILSFYTLQAKNLTNIRKETFTIHFYRCNGVEVFYDVLKYLFSNMDKGINLFDIIGIMSYYYSQDNKLFRISVYKLVNYPKLKNKLFTRK